MSEKPVEITRRDFLNLAWGGMALLAAGGSGYVGVRFLASRTADDAFGGIIAAGLIDDFPPNSVTAFNNGKFYLVRRADGGFAALYHKCTHLACVVLWDQDQQTFYCPCHGSRFEPDGSVLNRPATQALTRFPVILEDGQVLVDTGTPLDHDPVEPGDITYPDDQEAAS